ncbi:MAG: hypothetical protein CMH26_03190 [Micavibrio sp.]|nr:hypothetical protein [Micavibrio sp.]
MSLITTLYSFVAIISFCGYVPQILRLWKTQSDCRDVSIQAWGTWNATYIITVLYSIFEIKDFMLSLTATIHVICISIILAITFWKRYSYEKNMILSEQQIAAE